MPDLEPLPLPWLVERVRAMLAERGFTAPDVALERAARSIRREVSASLTSIRGDTQDVPRTTLYPTD